MSTANIKRMELNHRRSRIVIHNDTIYLAGMVPDDITTDITRQTKGALENAEKMLALAGSDKSHILSCTIWLRTMDDYQAMNDVYDAWIDKANPPTRACCQVKMARKDLRIEILFVAAVKK